MAAKRREAEILDDVRKALAGLRPLLAEVVDLRNTVDTAQGAARPGAPRSTYRQAIDLAVLVDFAERRGSFLVEAASAANPPNQSVRTMAGA